MNEVLLTVLLPGEVRDRIERRVKTWGVPLPRLLTVALDRLEEDVRGGRVDLSEVADRSTRVRRGHRA